MVDGALRGRTLVADKGYDAAWLADLARAQRGRVNIPMLATRRTRRRRFDPMLYRSRNVIERCFNKLKHFRRLATRYDKTARNFLAMLHLAASRLWTRYESRT